MKNPYQVLQQKEADVARVRAEVESLRLVALLLCDDARSEPPKKSIPAENFHDPDSEVTGIDAELISGPATRQSYYRFRSATDFLQSLHRR